MKLPRSGVALVALAVLCMLPAVLSAQFLLTPQPGSIFKEYARAMTGSYDFRVTDPNTTNTTAQTFLPNRVLNLSIGDLTGAVRAEVIFDLWGGHVGTTNKRFRFNSNAWITIPEMGSGNGIPAGTAGQCYIQQLNPTIAIPLSHLRVGNNSFEGTTGGQSCYNFNWGQFGWYGMVVRIYYGSTKPHPTGSITSPSSNTTIADNPVINVSASGSIAEVRVTAYHTGYDPDGDGVRQSYNYAYHRYKPETTFFMKNHVGTDNTAPYSFTWNNTLVPDQGGIKLMAWIKATDGTIYITDEVTNLTLARSGQFVRQYGITNMPERMWVRSGRTTKTVNFTIPSSDNLANARSATLVIPSWNGYDPSELGQFWTKVNTWTTPYYGADHFYALDFISVPLNQLRQGVNDFTIFASTIEHGIEVMWPGPHVIIRYGGTASNVPPSITQEPQPQTVTAGQTASFTVGATGTSPLTYQWQKNGVNISSNGTSSSYVTPATTTGDNGSLFRCIVSNPYGKDTSVAALLTVTSGNVPPTVTQDPQNRTVSVGQTASFSVVATGTATLTYQWQRNGVNIPTATSASYITPAVSLLDNGSLYRCIVSNSFGKDTSGAALLTVTNTPPADNLLQNPGFENGTSPWRFFTDGTGAFASVTPGFLGSFAGRISITTQGSNVQLHQTGFALQAGARYRLTFSAYSNTGHDLAVFVHKNTSPFTNYGLSNAVFALTTRYQTFTREFTAGGFVGSTTDTRLRFWFSPYDAAGDQFFIDDVKLEMIAGPASADLGSAPAVEEQTEEVPGDFVLAANYPNPFNPSTTIEFGLPEQAEVTLAVYNMLGQQVSLLASGTHAAGRHSAVWDARDQSGAQLGSGVYLYRLTATGISGRSYTSLQKMILMK